MKADIHPTYYPEATATCACGHTFTIGSTKEKVEVEVCSQCHPFYTGNEKVIDTAGRVEKFKARQAAAKSKGVGKSTAKVAAPKGDSKK